MKLALAWPARFVALRRSALRATVLRVSEMDMLEIMLFDGMIMID